jgi:hypothetical protein
MSSPQQQRFEDLPTRQKIEIIQALALFPAITVMVFLRKRLGFRILKPMWLFPMAAILIALPVFTPEKINSSGWALALFAVAMLGWGMFQRYRRWVELCDGVRWHTYSSGISYLEALPLPLFFRLHRRTYRMLDPIVCMLAGILISLVLSKLLGWWLMFSALALVVFEQNVYETALNRELDTLDGLIAAEVHKEGAEHFSGPAPAEQQRTLEETAGIPTGLAPDIERQIELRKARRAAAAPDNLEAAPGPTGPSPEPLAAGPTTATNLNPDAPTANFDVAPIPSAETVTPMPPTETVGSKQKPPDNLAT